MTDPLLMSNPANSEATPSVTSLQESEFGPTHSDKQGGPTTDQFGQEVVRANLSPMQAKALGLLTSGTFGQVGSTKSNMESIQTHRYLVNRLRLRVQKFGSNLFKMTWKESITKSGRLLPQLVVSVPRNREKEFISWVTPNARDYRDLSTTRGYLAQRKRHSPSVATKLLELGGNWKQVPQAYRILMGLAREFLRAYGNSLCSPQAQAFIESYLEVVHV